jgi:hypothetical protein
MLNFVESNNFYQTLETLAIKTNNLENLINEVLNTFDFNNSNPAKTVNFYKHLSVETWSDLFLVQEENLFGENDDLIYIINFNSLVLNDLVIEKLSELEGKFYLYSAQKPKFLVGDKKIFSKFKLETIKVQSNIEIRTQFANKFLELFNLNIPLDKIKEIVKNSVDYKEVLDILDFVYLSENTQKALDEVLLPVDPPLFFLKGTDYLKWAKYTREDDVQMALSLLFTKNPSLRNKIIKTDFKIKTISKIPAFTWFKYLLWEGSNQNF